MLGSIALLWNKLRRGKKKNTHLVKIVVTCIAGWEVYSDSDERLLHPNWRKVVLAGRPNWTSRRCCGSKWVGWGRRLRHHWSWNWWPWGGHAHRRSCNWVSKGHWISIGRHWWLHNSGWAKSSLNYKCSFLVQPLSWPLQLLSYPHSHIIHLIEES